MLRIEAARQRRGQDEDERGGAPGARGGVALSKVQSVGQRMRPWNAVSAFANCGRAVANVRGSYVPSTDMPIRP